MGYGFFMVGNLEWEVGRGGMVVGFRSNNQELLCGLRPTNFNYQL